jgi:signal peptidase I
MEIKKYLKAVWHFIWVEDSWLSWIVNVLLAFIIIKFLVYPGLGFALGTNYPIVAVVSSSMEHPVGFDDWWNLPSCNDQTSQGQLLEAFGIDKNEFLDFPFTGGFNKGDIMILYSPKILKIGDILTFNANTRNDPIIHRIVGVKEQNGKMYYQTKGDNNCGSADFEKSVTSEQAIGKAVWRIPLLGWIKIGFVNLIQLGGIM